jgi:hypothetical protein
MSICLVQPNWFLQPNLVAQKKEKKPKNRVVFQQFFMVSELIATKEMQVNLIYTKEEGVKENERIRLINFNFFFFFFFIFYFYLFYFFY